MSVLRIVKFMKLRYIIKVPNLIRLLLFTTAQQQQHTAYISSNLNTNRLFDPAAAAATVTVTSEVAVSFLSEVIAQM